MQTKIAEPDADSAKGTKAVGAGSGPAEGTPSATSHPLRRLLVVGLAGANVLVLVLLGISLYNAR